MSRRDGTDGDRPRSTRRWLWTILALSLIPRVVAAVGIQAHADRIGKPCLFGDTVLYVSLARSIAAGGPFVVDQWGIPHFALRTPGYPAFLAVCRMLFGPGLLPARLVQAGLGTLGVWAVHRLVRRVLPDEPESVPLIAAALAAIEPYGIGLGALILSEGVFIPLMLAGLWGLAVLWPSRDPVRAGGQGEGISRAGSTTLPLLVGLVHGAAILVRPSWALIVPGLLGLMVVGARRPLDRRSALRSGLLISVALAAVLTPWWVRNVRVIGRFVPTALWVGASLYDGVSPEATGASDMRFLEAPGVIGLGEVEQDAELRRRAWDFARSDPGRVVHLAALKFARFWSPWPNAETLRSKPAAAASALVTLPLFALAIVGAWDRRRDLKAITLLLGPLIYFLALHMVFVSSIRYRIPGFFPAFGLVAVGWRAISRRIRG